MTEKTRGPIPVAQALVEKNERIAALEAEVTRYRDIARRASDAQADAVDARNEYGDQLHEMGAELSRWQVQAQIAEHERDKWFDVASKWHSEYTALLDHWDRARRCSANWKQAAKRWRYKAKLEQRHRKIAHQSERRLMRERDEALAKAIKWEFIANSWRSLYQQVSGKRDNIYACSATWKQAAKRYRARFLASLEAGEAAQRELAECRADGWIAVDEALPEAGSVIIIRMHDDWDEYFELGYAMCDGAAWTWYDNRDEELRDVTHWRKLPPPPEG